MVFFNNLFPAKNKALLKASLPWKHKSSFKTFKSYVFNLPKLNVFFLNVFTVTMKIILINSTFFFFCETLTFLSFRSKYQSQKEICD